MAEISKEYAEALFALACEDGAEESVMSALDGICEIFENNPEYSDFLASPGIPLGERLSSAEQALDGRFHERAVSYMLLLCEKGRLGIFRESVEEFRRLLNVKRSVVTARVTSAVALTDGERAELTKKLEKISGNTVSLDCHVDPALLGGVIVEMNGRVMDGSLRHRLREVKDVINR